MFNIIDIIVILIILISVFLGYKKGFVKTVISLLSFFVAIGLALIFYKPLAVILTENTTIDDWIIENVTASREDENVLLNSGDNTFLESGEIIINENDATNNTTNNTTIETKPLETNDESATGMQMVFEVLETLPATVTNNIEFEEIKNNAKQEIAYKVSELIMNLLSLIIIYVVVKATLLVAMLVLNGIMQFPVLKQLNEILGMVIGAVIGFIQIYIAFAVITFISSVSDISIVIETIKMSAFARILFENNLIINLLF